MAFVNERKRFWIVTVLLLVVAVAIGYAILFSFRYLEIAVFILRDDHQALAVVHPAVRARRHAHQLRACELQADGPGAVRRRFGHAHGHRIALDRIGAVRATAQDRGQAEAGQEESKAVMLHSILINSS